MAVELVLYRNGKPALEDGLVKADLPIRCDRCPAEYRVHYSSGEINRPKGLETLQQRAQQRVSASHPNHLPTLSL